MKIKPLIFIPSPRDIPEVKRLWHIIPFDKFIVKYKPHLEAYNLGTEFFRRNTKYTHFIVCADDLEVTPEAINHLLNDIKKFEYETICGICNVDEVSKDTYVVQPLGCDYSRKGPLTTFEAWYHKEDKPKLPDEDIIEVGYAGFPCQIVSRNLFEKVSWKGATGQGNFDWQFAKDCYGLGVPIMCDTRVKLYHRRQQQYDRVNAYKTGDGFPEGYSFLLKSF